MNLQRFFSMFYVNCVIFARIRKPRLIWRILFNYLNIILLKKQYLRTVDFAPTYSCNCKCRHCFASYLANDKNEVMGVADYRRVAKQAKNMGAVHFAFQGGEPLLVPDLEGMIRAVDPGDCFVSITTNGFLLTEDKTRRLKQIGVDMVTVSIDSGDPHEHDRFRELPGSFDKALSAVTNALKHGLFVTVNTTITRDNLSSGGFEKIVRLCDTLKVKLNILYPAISGKWAGQTDLMLSVEEKAAIDKIIRNKKFIRRDLDANYMKYGCGAVKEMIYISAYGDVMPCSFIHVRLGNIKNDSLRYCIEKGLRVKIFRRYHECCPPMEDREFIDKYMSKIQKSDNIPPDFGDIFSDEKDL